MHCTAYVLIIFVFARGLKKRSQLGDNFQKKKNSDITATTGRILYTSLDLAIQTKV